MALAILDEDIARFGGLGPDIEAAPVASADYTFVTETFGTPPEHALERVVRFNSLELLSRRIFIILALRGENPDTLEGRLGISGEDAGALLHTAVLTILGREGGAS